MRARTQMLRVRGWEASYPLFTTVNRIIKNYIPPTSIFTFRVRWAHMKRNEGDHSQHHATLV